MNERISAFLVRLGADPALRARFDQTAAAVMDEAGLSAEEQAELLRHMRQEASRGRIFAASTMESSADEPGFEQPEGRIHAPEETPEGTSAEMPDAWPERVYSDSADDSPDTVSGAAPDDTAEDLSDEVFGDSADDSPRGSGA